MKCVRKLHPGMFVTVHEPFCLDLKFVRILADESVLFLDGDVEFIVPRHHPVSLLRGCTVGAIYILEARPKFIRVLLKFPQEVKLSYDSKSGLPFLPTRSASELVQSSVR